MKAPWRVALFCIVALFIAQRAPAQNTAFVDALKQNRFAIDARDAKLAGSGADVLRTAMADAQFVLIGEDHGIQQIPGFVGAVCNDLAPLGFHTMTLETGPSITPELEKFARSADGLQQLAEFEKKFPASVAFYNWREEFAMLANCEKAAGAEGMTLWGIDQELMGASGFLLEKIRATNPGPQAKATVEALLKENADDYAAAAKTGNPGEVFMMKAKQEELDAARDILKKEGSAEAQQLFGALLVSRDIYAKNMSGSYYPSNRQRAQLMKNNFVAQFGPAMQKGGPPKVLFKFGGWHMYRGLNPIHSSEIGNLANEFAEAHGLKSVSILVLGVKGEQSHFAGIGKPFQAAPLDLVSDKNSEFAFMGPFLANQLENQWTIFDLRALRNRFASYGKMDPELERLTFGMDFVVLIPNPKASHQVQ
jgi:hypothetical protein